MQEERVGWKYLGCNYYHVAKFRGRKFINRESMKGAARASTASKSDREKWREAPFCSRVLYNAEVW